MGLGQDFRTGMLFQDQQHTVYLSRDISYLANGDLNVQADH